MPEPRPGDGAVPSDAAAPSDSGAAGGAAVGRAAPAEPAAPADIAARSGSAGTGALPALLAFLAALATGVPALHTWWHQDDWGLLARAAHLIAGEATPARWLSRVAYWDLAWPLFHLDPLPYAATRVLLHGGCAALVARIARRLGMPPLGQAVAGLLFAATPLAFTPLVWASGIQELLAACLALAAIERWLAATGPAAEAGAGPSAESAVGSAASSAARVAAAPAAKPRLGSPAGRNLAAAALLGAAAILAKECAIGLGALFALLLWARPQGRRTRPGRGEVAVVAALGALGVAAALAALHAFDTSKGTPFAMGGASNALAHLLTYGYWLISPGPFLRAFFATPHLLAGLLIWAGWAVWGATRWRRGDGRPLAFLAGSLLALAPAAPLATHVAPYMAYLAAAGSSLAAVLLLPRSWIAEAPDESGGESGAGAGAPQAAAPDEALPATGGDAATPTPGSSSRRSALVPLLISLAALGAVAGWTRSEAAWRARGPDGRPRDSQVARARTSRAAIRTLSAFVAAGARESKPVTDFVLLQVPATEPIARMADKLAANMVLPSEMYTSLQGVLGPTVVFGKGVTFRWQNRLDDVTPGAVVLVEDGDRWRFWGQVDQARLYLTLAAVGRGQYQRAMRSLLQAAFAGGEKLPFLYDADQLLAAPAQIQANAAGFEAYLQSPESKLPPNIGDALQATFRDLLLVVSEPAPPSPSAPPPAR